MEKPELKSEDVDSAQDDLISLKVIFIVRLKSLAIIASKIAALIAMFRWPSRGA
jgi:hypothetical protein